MSVRTRVDAPRRAAKSAERGAAKSAERGAAKSAERGAAKSAERGAAKSAERAESRRLHDAENAKSGAAKRAYARRRNRVEGAVGLPPLPGRAASAMAGRIPFVAAIIALLGCGLMCTLLLTTRSAEDSYQLGDARRINQQLSDEQAELQRQVAAADSAPELASRARDLGMIPAKDPARLVVAPDGAVTVVGKDTPQEGPPAPPLNTSPAAPAPVAPNLVQAQGERLVPVTPAQTPNPASRNPAVQAAPHATSAPAARDAVAAPAQAIPAAPANSLEAAPAQSPAARGSAAPTPAAPAAAAAPAAVPAPAAGAAIPAPAAAAQNPAAPAVTEPTPQAPDAPVDQPVPVANPAPAAQPAPEPPAQTPAPQPAAVDGAGR